LRKIIVGFGLLALCCSAARGQSLGEQGPPTAARCAAVYGAFAEDQGAFGASDSLLGERYFNYGKINFEDRLGLLAGKAEKGITELKAASESERSAFYMKLVDAETEGDMEAPAIRDMIRLSDSCDAEYGFSPSLGG
jgi:hypothetical protein